jgi:energy-converting hydrogenase Eha subunit H
MFGPFGDLVLFVALSFFALLIYGLLFLVLVALTTPDDKQVDSD